MMHPTTAEFLVRDHQRELLEDADRSRLFRRPRKLQGYRRRRGLAD